jgi:spore germination protein YaaH/putative cell wall-binding protein
MPSTRRSGPLALALIVALLAMPLPAAAADPPLGPAVTLPDGTVLPPMPAAQVTPSVQSQMLAQHGGVAPQNTGFISQAAGADAGNIQVADPLVVAPGGAPGPAGPLPNGLRREVLGFLPYWKLDTTTRAALRLDLVSTIAYFGISAQPDGSLTRGTSVGWVGWTSSAMTELVNAAHAHGVRVVPTITMMAWSGDYTAMSTLLNDTGARGRLVADIATIIAERGVDGVNIDFEPVPSGLRSQFTAFILELKAGLVARAVGSYVTVDTMGGAATWATGYDVAGLTAPGAADALMVMAYDFSYSGSARAGAVAPIDSDFIFASADAMRDHVARVPASKLIWGIPYYGRAWNTVDDAQNSPVRSPAQSVAFSYYWTDNGEPAGGKILAARHGRRWDATGQVPWFAFWDSGSGGYRQGYYDDPTSLRAKYDMVVGNGAAGIGIWHLGMDTGVSDLWDLLEDRFVKALARLAGADRYATAAAVSQAAFAPGVPVAYVATGTAFPDALAAGPPAALAGGPVLLTGPASLPPATAVELGRLLPARIVVLGGAGAVSDGVLAALRGYATSGSVTRLAGADRYGTAAATSAATFAPGVPVAYVATGRNFPDALAGGVAASREGGPILLVGPTAVPAATANELARLRPARIVVLGGTGVVSDGVLAALRGYATSGNVSRLSGPDRYATAIAISQATTGSDAPRAVYLATGAAFADGLAGTPAAARAGGPLLILPAGSLPQAIRDELRRLNAPRVVILGGPGAVSDALAAEIAALQN